MFTTMRAFARPAQLRLVRPAFSAPATRTFSRAANLRIKEDANRTPEELDNLKNEQVKKQEKGEGHWHEGLASNSEAGIAADKENPDDHGEHMEDLQKETAGQAEKDSPHGKAEH